MKQDLGARNDLHSYSSKNLYTWVRTSPHYGMTEGPTYRMKNSAHEVRPHNIVNRNWLCGMTQHDPKIKASLRRNAHMRRPHERVSWVALEQSDDGHGSRIR
ncbi:hypothetical protein JTE90_016403 [Oedothorax gibbosus]|uniref:Uncharacterized protein n=1 Tax=Oedothorax gibbosus TaxID=931172 RepID=A0AAV6TEF2_9ARAC|nr:hypothetical protein JTE90_016403 [Oedothorax gibbosus]